MYKERKKKYTLQNERGEEALNRNHRAYIVRLPLLQLMLATSLRSKRFQSRYYIARKLEREQKKWKGEGEGRRGNACPQTPRFWKTPLDISRFGSFVS